jgi:hypothetical protein
VKKEAHDWSASVWFSPILKNPQSFFVMGGAAIAASGCGLVVASRLAFPGLFFLSFGLGALTGVLAFRIKMNGFRFEVRQWEDWTVALVMGCEARD